MSTPIVSINIGYAEVREIAADNGIDPAVAIQRVEAALVNPNAFAEAERLVIQRVINIIKGVG